MATEKRLIDANDFKMLLQAVRQKYLEQDTFSSRFAAVVIETVQANYIELAPTVDAVEVVRCRDCEHWKEPWLEGVTSGKCMLGKTMITETDHFCSYGERKINK